MNREDMIKTIINNIRYTDRMLDLTSRWVKTGLIEYYNYEIDYNPVLKVPIYCSFSGKSVSITIDEYAYFLENKDLTNHPMVLMSYDVRNYKDTPKEIVQEIEVLKKYVRNYKDFVEKHTSDILNKIKQNLGLQTSKEGILNEVRVHIHVSNIEFPAYKISIKPIREMLGLRYELYVHKNGVITMKIESPNIGIIEAHRITAIKEPKEFDITISPEKSADKLLRFHINTSSILIDITDIYVQLMNKVEPIYVLLRVFP